ncbi:hypothetical protein HMPREF3038_02867 [Akkermansia sp. KLE1797]|nr:hypothetical protein HMPREF3038_02867 [Akkermansia sp. KLE1797]KXU52662.1 hypothetical protein HMPREF3039_03187 [Akkermansia sp. KLE1798]KZA04090.1 hypothetical protein HMPREF1326_02288 [Akkermansia sp. KLE1605]
MVFIFHNYAQPNTVPNLTENFQCRGEFLIRQQLKILTVNELFIIKY